MPKDYVRCSRCKKGFIIETGDYHYEWIRVRCVQCKGYAYNDPDE